MSVEGAVSLLKSVIIITFAIYYIYVFTFYCGYSLLKIRRSQVSTVITGNSDNSY